ncbi:MAG TPA: succinate dehydrogenase assembly factor 2 [Arenimonas sp.]|nr:succinate dehydrogenase assembly factor 2 [Arenimonas sp.]
MNDLIDPEIKRLRWRCRRGMRELDQLMLRYLDRRWSIADDQERKLFLHLLDCEDDKLWRWFMGLERSEDESTNVIIKVISEIPV